MEFEGKGERQRRLAIAGLGWASTEADEILDLDVSVYLGRFTPEDDGKNATSAGQEGEVALLRKALLGAWDDALRHLGPASGKVDEGRTLLLLPEGQAHAIAAGLLAVSLPNRPTSVDSKEGPAHQETTAEAATIETLVGGRSFLSGALSRATTAFARGEANLVLISAIGQWPRGDDVVGQGAGEDEGAGADTEERNGHVVAIALALRWATGDEGDQDYAIFARPVDPLGSTLGARSSCAGDFPVGSLEAKRQVGLAAVVFEKDEFDHQNLYKPAARKLFGPETRHEDVRADALLLAPGSGRAAGAGEHPCALVPVLAPDEASYPLASLMALSRVALALAHGYLPRVDPWLRDIAAKPVLSGASMVLLNSSRPWFTSPARPRRTAALFLSRVLQDGQSGPAEEVGLLHGVGFERGRREPTEGESDSGTGTSVVMESSANEGDRLAGSSWMLAEGELRKGSFGNVIRRAKWRLFPLVGQDTQEILSQADSLRHGLEMGLRMSDLSARAMDSLFRARGSVKVAVLLARSAEELDKEIARALTGIPAAAQKGGLWQTPNGSAFAVRPLGAGARVAFVYPGGFNSYPQIGRDLFFWFPWLYESMGVITSDLGQDLREDLLYPWRDNSEVPADAAGRPQGLADDPVGMLTSGTTLSILYTQIMERTFKLQPSVAFGYSLGENSMLFSSGVWRNGDQMVEALTRSEVFRTELAGPQRTVRRAWGRIGGDEGPVWSNFLLMAPAEKVRDALQGKRTVYLTHINSPGQVMIGGDRAACLRVADELGCRVLEASFNVALHCRVVEPQRAALRALHNWPVQGEPGTQLFSAATYGPLKIEQQAIASSMAQMLVSPLDFVRLVQTVYREGARVFVELGAGSNCSRWIDETLKEVPHVSVSVNHRGVDDLQGIMRVVARLISEGVPLDLAELA